MICREGTKLLRREFEKGWTENTYTYKKENAKDDMKHEIENRKNRSAWIGNQSRRTDGAWG